MSAPATPGPNPSPSAYAGALTIQTGRPILPARYAAAGSWERVALAIARDLVSLRTSHAAFSAIAHAVADQMSALEIAGGGR